jgi:murein DD-endopeptidase MepM/ murein hydrolase activator NlpD
MRFGILRKYEQKLARGAAILVVGGLAAGCSSQVDRFSESLFTGSSYPRAQRTASLSEQPYPGDTNFGNLDRNPTGSVGERVVRPDVPVGGSGMMTGNTQIAPTNRAPATAAPVGGVQRGSISSAPLAPVSTSNVPAQSRLAPVSGASQPAANTNNTRAAASTSGKGTKITVRPGETVYNLSQRFGVPESAIVAANGLGSASALQAGQTIVIPAYAYSETAKGSQPDAGKRANALPAPSKPGQAPAQQKQERVAVLPRAESSKEERSSASLDADRSDSQAAAAGSVYTVASGDTLYGISKKTGVSVSDLKAANGLSNGYIRIGQQLKLSASAAPSAPMDEPKTATAAKPEQQEIKEEKVASYTPPKKADEPAKSVDAKVENQETAALPPDSTGIGRLRWPVHGRIVSSFGSVGAAGDGIDIAVPEGTPVKAAENGVVIYAGDGLKEFGKTVLVRHEDGLVTVYGYTSDIKVERGDTVKRGQVIALSGMTGSADRPKLHFEVRKDAAPVNPTKYLD